MSAPDMDMDTIFTFKSGSGMLTDGDVMSFNPISVLGETTITCTTETCHHGQCQMTNTGVSQCVCDSFWSGQQCSKCK